MPSDVFIPGHPDGWPPPLRLRVSPRARHVRITVSPKDGLVMVVPVGFGATRYLDFLAAKRSWVERHLALRRQRFPELASAEARSGPAAPPDALEFRAVGERFDCEYVRVPGRPRLRENQGSRLLVACGENFAGAGELLAAFVKKSGQRILPAMLANEAASAGLAFSGCTVGLAARRWGSCNARGQVRLSAKLLFLPPPLARHVILHELAHLKHLNHSKSYYRALEKLDPNHREHSRELNLAQDYIPAILW